MADLNTFGEDITGFRLGNLEYLYNFNSAGNLFFKEDPDKLNEAFLKVNVRNSEYDYNKLSKFYNLSFEEFSSQPPTSSDNVKTENDYKLQVSQLKSQISASSASDANESVYRLKSELKASRDIIVGLRISAGEGSTDEDFSDEFPFYPKKGVTISNK